MVHSRPVRDVQRGVPGEHIGDELVGGTHLAGSNFNPTKIWSYLCFWPTILDDRDTEIHRAPSQIDLAWLQGQLLNNNQTFLVFTRGVRFGGSPWGEPLGGFPGRVTPRDPLGGDPLGGSPGGIPGGVPLEDPPRGSPEVPGV